MPADAEIPFTIEFSLELSTEPLGADLSVRVPDAPSDEARQKLLDGIENSLVGGQGNLVSQSIQQAHSNLDRYAGEHDYEVESIKGSLTLPDAERDRTGITVEWAWEHPAAMFMEFGTSDHQAPEDGLAVFEFDAAEYPYLAEMFPDGVAFLPSPTVSGLPEARWVRDSLNWLRRRVGQ